MKKIIIIGILLILSISMASAIEECTQNINYADIPCIVYLGITNYTSCSAINLTVYNSTSEIYTIKMSSIINPNLCNATFNQTDAGTYTLRYSDGNFTDTGSIIVEGSKMEWLIWLAAALGSMLFVIAYLSKDRNLLTLCGFMYGVTGVMIVALGYGSIQNVWTDAIGMIVFGVGAIFMVVPNVEFFADILGR